MKKFFAAMLAVMLGVMMLIPATTVAIAENSLVYTFSDAKPQKTKKDKGFTKAEPIKKGDVHFGWQLGEFKLTGFSEKKMENGIPVFLVNPGDEITLSYTLKQDIDNLNGKKNLSISYDKNTYDAEYCQQNTNFGRGALFIRTTNYMNKQDTQSYFDYLTGVQSASPKTTVSVLEEGDYEVVLDYEIASGRIKSYTNYQTKFSFKIRNSGCMVYLRDLENNELANCSVAESGFSVTTTSFYQQVRVKRETLTHNGYGYSLTPRANKAVKDQESFTDEGIYTVTVKNPYTEEAVEMKVAVGTEQIANAYVMENCIYSPDEIDEMVEKGMARITDDWRIEMIQEAEAAREPATLAMRSGVSMGDWDNQFAGSNNMYGTIITGGCIVLVALVSGIVAACKKSKAKRKAASLASAETNDESSEA